MKPFQPIQPKGEVFVWLTAMGLAASLAMITGLLLLVFINGISVFWPQRVVQIELHPDAPAFHGSHTVTGIIVGEQANATHPDRIELKLFVGNRETYGVSFAFFDTAHIVNITRPREILFAERMEWGSGLLFPDRIVFADGTATRATDNSFADTLQRQLVQVHERRREIHNIERRQIGRINEQMRRLELDRRFLQNLRERSEAEEAQLQQVLQRIAVLQSDFEPLAAQAAALRRQLNENRFEFTLATGQSRSLPIGDLVHVYAPNSLNFVQRVGMFFHHLWAFLSQYPREANTEGGIWPAIFGTFIMTVLMSAAVTPFGVMAAIYLREYAKQGFFVRAVRIAINNLAGVPSIVFGIFGLGFFVYFVGGNIDRIFFPRATEMGTPTFGTGGVLWASLTLALLTVPVVIVATEEALAAVSRGVREGSLACGASKWQTIQYLVLPAAAPGILTGLVLAMARGAGEVAPLILVGVVAFAPALPVDAIFPFIHLERKFMHLGFHIYDLGFQSPDSEAAQPMVFATTLILILLVVALNLAAILIRNKLRRRYAAQAF